MWLLNALKTVGDLVAVPLTGYVERKKIEAQSRARIEQATTDGRVERLRAGQQIEAELEHKHLEHSGWKDEWFVILLSTPVILCFGGDTGAAWALQGFAALNETPEWFRYLFGIAVTTSFGIRKLEHFVGKRKGFK